MGSIAISRRLANKTINFFGLITTLIERHRSSHLVLTKTLNMVSLCHYLQVEVVALRTRKERQQAAT